MTCHFNVFYSRIIFKVVRKSVYRLSVFVEIIDQSIINNVVELKVNLFLPKLGNLKYFQNTLLPTSIHFEPIFSNLNSLLTYICIIINYSLVNAALN